MDSVNVGVIGCTMSEEFFLASSMSLKYILPFFSVSYVSLPLPRTKTISFASAILIAFFIGATLYKIDYQLNIILIILISLLYILAITNLGLLLSMLKSQVATTLIAIFILIYPVFDVITYVSVSMPKIAQFVIYMLPGKVFIEALNGMMFNGVVLWWHIVSFSVQIIVFYIMSLLILKRKLMR